MSFALTFICAKACTFIPATNERDRQVHDAPFIVMQATPNSCANSHSQTHSPTLTPRRETTWVLDMAFSVLPWPNEEQCAKLAARCGATPEFVAQYFLQRNMLEGATRPGMDMHVFTAIEPPYQIMWASEDWLSFCGFSFHELENHSLEVIQGPETSRKVIDAIMASVKACQPITATVLNYTKRRVPFYHTVKIEPLTNSAGEPQLFRVESQQITSVARSFSQDLQPAPARTPHMPAQPLDAMYGTAVL